MHLARIAACSFFLAAASLVATPTYLRADPRQMRWEQITEDLELAQVTIPVSSLLSSELLFIRSSLRRYRVGIIQATEFGWRRNTVAAMGKASKATAAINANFFDEQGRALGLVISRGILIQGVHKGGGTLSGIFQAGPLGLKIMSRADFTPIGVSDAIQAGPRLVHESAKITGIREPSTFSRRSGVCIDRQGRLLLFAVSSGLLGISLEQLQNELLRPEIGCVEALNLDGGGSTQLWVNGALTGAPSGFEEIFIQASDSVPVALALFQKDAAADPQ
ncbi:MAG: phosphodiester glycosidase family protein [Proteobacteria bacterium]|nr:phosphodiester glycosidase family protein [Pseudomonadota bacterium]